MSDKFIVVLCTCPADDDTASDIASLLVESGLAACCNILPNVQSIFKWEGEIEMNEEVLMMIKTTEAKYPQMEEVITAHHPYELPEIISVPVTKGLPDYLEWVKNNLR